MEGLETRVLEAAQSRQALGQLVEEYLPFIKKQAARAQLGLDYDERVSLATLTFARCAATYEAERGGFLSYAQVCIHNRLVDEARRQNRLHSQVTELYPEQGEGPESVISLAAYDRAEENRWLAEEIAQLAAELAEYGVTFQALTQCSPSHRQARLRCMALARAVTEDALLSKAFSVSRRLPQGELARRFGLSVKTVEKHRKYIVALAVVLRGDYPGIRGFLPKEVD